NLRDYARAYALPMVAIEVPPQMQLLSRLDFFAETQDAAVAADEERFRCLLESSARRRGPQYLNGHAQRHAVALTKSVSQNTSHRSASFKLTCAKPSAWTGDRAVCRSV